MKEIESLFDIEVIIYFDTLVTIIMTSQNIYVMRTEMFLYLSQLYNQLQDILEKY